MNIQNIKIAKQKIIDQMYLDFHNTVTDERYFSIENIKKCDQDLEKYIELLANAQRQQKEISKAIQWVFKVLSTFGGTDEDPEFLWGFMFNGYTEQLTDFILNTAFEYGLEKSKAKKIKTKFFYIKHNPHFLQVFRVYIGSTLTNGIILEYNARQSCFEFIENPYGENYTIPILNLKINPDLSELSFDVLKAEGFKTIHLKAQNKLDQLLLQAIWKLNQKNYFSTPPDSNFCNIEIELDQGVLTHLKTLNFDKNNKIIDMFSEGSGIRLLVQALDATGAFQNSENLSPHPEIVCEKFIIVDAVPEWKYYEIQELNMAGNNISVMTKNQLYRYDEQNSQNVIGLETPCKKLIYPINTYHFMSEILQDIFIHRASFRARFDK